ncbi:MAG: hypothetical protein MJE77_22230 [Proteobacteria bacterium]|nr:hypothetical protein [Pseudomonadota bacterium]
MRNRFDQLAKAILGALLRPVAPVETGREIPGQVQIADLWVEPDGEEHAEVLERLGVLGRMIGLGPCLIEPFSQAPRVKDIRSCIRKQYTLDHHLVREADREDRPEPEFPILYVISSGKPETIIDKMELCKIDGWPVGFWQGREFDAFYLVVARLLPETPDTLFLRLLGRGITFREAVRELVTDPEHAWARRLLEPVLVAFRREIPQDSMEEEDMKALRELEAVYADWEQRVKEEGERIGLVESIEMLCAAFNIELSEERRELLAGCDIARLKEVFAAVSTSRGWPSWLDSAE